MVPQLVPVAKAIMTETIKDKVGICEAETPPTSQELKSLSTPTAVMMEPIAHAKVKTTKAGKMRIIPYKKASNEVNMFMTTRGLLGSSSSPSCFLAGKINALIMSGVGRTNLPS